MRVVEALEIPAIFIGAALEIAQPIAQEAG